MLENFIENGLYSRINKVLFGAENSEKKNLHVWHNSAFRFSEITPFTLLQTQGGVCGVLVAVQAFLLKHMIFGENGTKNLQNLTIGKIYDCFANALTDIIVICHGENAKEYNLVIPKSFDGQPLNGENIRNHLILTKLKTKEILKSQIKSELDSFRNGPGILALVCSAILGRGIDNVKKDMDDPNDFLIRRECYCTQELVNLLISGRAASNVFDGEKRLGDNGNDEYVLTGIPERTDIGFLTILEAQGYTKVGEYYKTPKYPIWVVGSNDHYTVLFSTEDKLVLLSKDEELELGIRRIFNSFDQFETGYLDYKSLPELLQKLRLNKVQTAFVESQLIKNKDSEVFLLQQLINAAMDSIKEFWSCPKCSFANSNEDSRCQTCQTEKESSVFERDNKESSNKEPLKTAELWHYNGMKLPGKNSGKLSELKIYFDHGYNLAQVGDNLRAVIHTKWPDSHVEFIKGTEKEVFI